MDRRKSLASTKLSENRINRQPHILYTNTVAFPTPKNSLCQTNTMSKLAIGFTIFLSLFVLSHARGLPSFNLPSLWKPSATSSPQSEANKEETIQPIRLPSEGMIQRSKIPTTYKVVRAQILKPPTVTKNPNTPMRALQPLAVSCDISFHPVNRHFRHLPTHHCHHQTKPRFVPAELQRKIPVFLGDFIRYRKEQPRPSLPSNFKMPMSVDEIFEEPMEEEEQRKEEKREEEDSYFKSFRKFLNPFEGQVLGS